MLIVGLVGLVRSGAAGTGWLARIGFAAAFLGLGLFTAADAAIRSASDIGEHLHPVSVPLTGVGMLLIGVAVLRARLWHGWQRLTPAVCGVVPFAVELPAFFILGDQDVLLYFIVLTWTSWVALNAALWTAPASPAGVTAR